MATVNGQTYTTAKGSCTARTSYYKFYVGWRLISQNKAANQSTIEVITYWTHSSGYTFDTVGSDRPWSITVAGSTKSGKKRQDYSPWPSNPIASSAQFTVTHAANGTCSVAISARTNGYASSYGPSNSISSSGDCTASITATLPTISFTNTSAHYQRNAANTAWTQFKVETKATARNSTFTPAFTTAPTGYYASSYNTWTSGYGTHLGSGSVTITSDTITELYYYPNKYSYDLNVLLPDGSQPWQTGAAGSVEISINGGSWTRIYNEAASSYPYGTTFKFRNFTPGTGLKLNSVTGVTANSDGTWSATMGTSGLNINFSTAYQTYTNRIDHWTWGFTKQEGTNGSKNAYPLGSTYFNQNYGSSYSLNTDRATTIPAGFTLRNKFGTSSISGSWAQYNMGTTVTQAAGTMSYEYDYDPIAYSISYELDGGTNNSSNPISYNVLYGFTLAEPTKTNSKFLGWYKKNAKINYTLSASNNNYSYYTARTGIKPGEKYCVKIDSATRTAGTATQFTALFYDFTDQAWVSNAVVNFGNNLEFWLSCPSSYASGHNIHMILYAGIAGATANNNVSVSGLEIQELTTGISQPANSFANTDAFYAAMSSRVKGNVTFVAKWELLACYVTYNGNGNIVSNIPAKQEKIIGTNITLSSTKPTRGDRYKFLGWAESSSATSATYQPGATFTKDVDITLYAVWQLLDKDIYLYNTGKIDAVDFKTVSAVTDLFDNNGNVYATQFVTHSESNIYIDKDGKIYAKEFIKY